MTLATAELCDAQPENARIVRAPFLSFGAVTAFAGPCCPVRLHESDAALKALLSTPGEGRVAVVEVTSRRGPAVFGEGMALRAAENGWAGVLIDGAVRDIASFAARGIGVRAREVVPFILRGGTAGGEAESVDFAGLSVTAQDHAVVDADGIVFIHSDLL